MDAMLFTPYQIVTPVVSALAVYYAWSLWFRQRKTLWEAVLWTGFWGGIAGVAMFPESLHYFRVLTGIKSSASAVLVPVIGIIAFIVFTIIIRLEELQQRHADLIRTIALKDAELADRSASAPDDRPSA